MAIFSKNYVKIILFIISLLCVFLLYSFKIDDPALGLFCDEADVGVHAASIAENLHDINGKKLPFLFESFKNYKFPVYVYSTALIVKIVGLNVYNIRILAVISAVMGVGFLYLIARRLFGFPVAFIAALFLTLTPGFFHLQRSAMGTHTFVGCYLAAIYFLIWYLEKKTLFRFILFLIFVFLTWWSYAPATVFVICSVILTILFHIIQEKKINVEYFKRNKLKGLILVIIAYVLLILPISFGYKAVHYSNKVLINHSFEELNDNNILYFFKAHLPEAENIYLKSPKIIKEASIFFYHYYYSYSPKFLFTRGDANYRHIIPEKAPLPLLFMFLLPIGFFICVREFNQLKYKYLLAAVLSIGVPSAMLIVDVELIHNLQMYPVFALLAAIGLVELVQLTSQMKLVRVVYYLLALLFVLLSFVSYFNYYFGEYKESSSSEWQAFREQILEFVAENKDKYNKIYHSGQIHEINTSLVFYGKALYGFKISDYQKTKKKLPFDMKMLDHTLYGNNIQFDSLKEVYGDNILLILNPLELPECEPIKTLYYKNDYSDNGKTPFVKFCEL